MNLRIIEECKKRKEAQKQKERERKLKLRLKLKEKNKKKKRRKKKKKKKVIKKPIDRKRRYHIILVNHGKQLHDLYSGNEKQAMAKFAEMLKENKNIMFPIRWNNLKHVMVQAEYELIMIKEREEGETQTVTKLRDDTGKFINYESNNEKWYIYDRAPYDIEETFWVYGYHPRLQRKDFNWIFDNFIVRDAKNKYNFKLIGTYNNKLIIECCEVLDLVICKTKSDCIRLYNLIEEQAHKKKFKYISFMGDIMYSKYKSMWIQKMKKLTGWNDRKMERTSTRP